MEIGACWQGMGWSEAEITIEIPEVGSQVNPEHLLSEAEPILRCPWVFLDSMASLEMFHSWNETAGRRTKHDEAVFSEVRAVKMLKAFPVCNISLQWKLWFSYTWLFSKRVWSARATYLGPVGGFWEETGLPPKRKERDFQLQRS